MKEHIMNIQPQKMIRRGKLRLSPGRALLLLSVLSVAAILLEFIHRKNLSAKRIVYYGKDHIIPGIFQQTGISFEAPEYSLDGACNFTNGLIPKWVITLAAETAIADQIRNVCFTMQ
ncbi:MAG: hypothetical protein HPZ91_12190 [Lentisphaeria bacterium]|nr:hypothetical protein [Lentisphaeria bacterium]